MIRDRSGSVEAFHTNWSRRLKSKHFYFKRGTPENQVQFAFQNHWRVFRQILNEIRSGRVLEIGCGRGSMSAFLADAGFEVYLLDISPMVLQIARENFSANGLKGYYICGDALALPYSSGTFDVVLSIGLLEHFAEIERPLSEQVRVLKPGGVLLGYIVPEQAISVQTMALPLNCVLRLGYTVYRVLKKDISDQDGQAKVPLYRNHYKARHYLSVLHRLGIEKAGSFGMFPLPLISHSPDFPFTPMAAPLERTLVRLWQLLLTARSGQRHDPWMCSEGWGLAFSVWAKKGRPNDSKE